MEAIVKYTTIAILSLLVAPLVTMLAAWDPARQAAELPIIEAIRHEAAALGKKKQV